MAKENVAINAHILVVDDLMIGRELAKEILELMGCKVDIVSSGDKAIQACQKTQYDLVLIDIEMPGMNGFETAKEIRALLQHDESIPIIAFSANVMDGAYRMECLENGMDDCISKPIRFEVLEHIIRKYTEPAPLMV